MYLTYPFQIGHATLWARGKPENFHIPDWNRGESFGPILRVLEELGIRRAVVPIPGFNATVLAATDLPKEFGGKVRIRSGRRADGILLKRGEACVMPSGDCHTTVVWNERVTDPGLPDIAVLHTGRDPLLPAHLRAVRRPVDEREEDSVIDVLLRTTGWNPQDLHVRVCLGIGPEHFTHPFDHAKHGRRNSMRSAYIKKEFPDDFSAILPGNPKEGQLDMLALNRCLWQSRGVALERVKSDGIDTASQSGRWWSNRIGDTGRNAVIVANGRK